jgi:hypothetical protein
MYKHLNEFKEDTNKQLNDKECKAGHEGKNQ